MHLASGRKKSGPAILSGCWVLSVLHHVINYVTFIDTLSMCSQGVVCWRIRLHVCYLLMTNTSTVVWLASV